MLWNFIPSTKRLFKKKNKKFTRFKLKRVGEEKNPPFVSYQLAEAGKLFLVHFSVIKYLAFAYVHRDIFLFVLTHSLEMDCCSRYD